KLADRGVILLIAGDGRKRRQWEDEARRLHPQLRAIFTGRIPYRQAGDYISLADVCAMPLTSKRNARIGVSPIKLYAYLACGKPIVATQIRGFEFLQTEGLGTTIPCGDIDAYAGALRDWLNKTPAQAGHISRRARAYAEKHCGWDRIAQSVFAVCRTLRKSE
ncbi:MAG: glycosyltransferase, partial [Sedimentisphaerales bacterium]|nr:glycosyltransferase [Sedimentisphaerales bacterium]